MPDLDLFNIEDGEAGIENYAHDNGLHFWYASDVAMALGYDDFAAFKKTVLNKAITVCMTAGFIIIEHFEQCPREINGVVIDDIKLSRFAFFLTAINGNLAKPNVQRAQAYFAEFADAAAQLIEEREVGERLWVRGEISKSAIALDSVAKGHGLTDYSRFHNAGYMGMYNRGYNELRRMKGIPSDRSPLDFMGQRELAGNFFRLNETKERISISGARGDYALQNTARTVGAEVREFMMRDGGTPPELLPPHRDIQEAKKALKSTGKVLNKIDAPKKPTKRKK
jgi:DNA-damage-inducible protein D